MLSPSAILLNTATFYYPYKCAHLSVLFRLTALFWLLLQVAERVASGLLRVCVATSAVPTVCTVLKHASMFILLYISGVHYIL
jgi:hypothetical protein